MRFWPSSSSLSPALHWVLERAFASERSWTPLTASAADAVGMAQQLKLLARIFSRVSPERLRQELGATHAHAASRHLVAVARALALARTIADIDAIASERSLAFCFIKGAALSQANLVSLACRGASDIDVLVESGRANELQAALVERGFRARGALRPLYHLPVLTDDSGGVIEVHTGISNMGPRSELSLAELTAAKLLEPAPGLSPLAHIPTREFLLAHALAHGIAHHGFLPLTYPLMKMLADVVDIGAELSNQWGELIARWLRPYVSDDEVAAVRTVASHLAAGTFEQIWDGASPASRLLRHCVLGSLDERYARGLWLHHTAYTRVAQWRTWGSRQFAAQIWNRVSQRAAARILLSGRDYQQQFGLEARGHDHAEFRWSSLPATLEVLKRTLRGSPRM